jgi:hypothetical protein
MGGKLGVFEKKITDFWTKFFQKSLFFLNENYQSLIVSIIHYAIFIVGTIYFLFYSTPGDRFRVFYFIIVLLAAISYFVFNKCFVTSIERQLSNNKNIIQRFFDRHFGEETEGNIVSKYFLSLSSMFLGSTLLIKDYPLFNIPAEVG